MSADFEYVLNITVPKDLGRQIEGRSGEGFRVESRGADDEDSTARFGVAEAIVLVGLAKGTVEVVKLGVETWQLLRARAQRDGDRTTAVSISTPDESTVVLVTAAMEREEVEAEISRAFTDEKP